MDTKIELMSVYEDNISGFKGIAIGITQWAWGCITIGLSPKGLDKDGKIRETEWFDEDRLILVGFAADPPTEVTGGPEHMGPGKVNR